MTEPTTPPTGRRFLRWRLVGDRLRRPIVVVAAVGTVLGGLAGYVTMYRTVARDAPAPAAAAGHRPAAGPLSVLVLPLSNQTGDPTRNYVAEGLTTALTSDLTRLADAVVVPPLHAVALQRQNLSLDQLASQAGVRYVLQGAVAGDADRLRVTTQLLDAGSGQQLWGRVFETTTARLFEVQDELTQRIRVSIGARMVQHAAREALQRQEKPQIADLLIRFRALELQPQTLPRLQEQEDLARRALALEPQNLQAKAALASSLWLQAGNFTRTVGRDPNAVMRDAARYAGEVLAVDPEHLTSIQVVATAAQRSPDLESARALYERALAIDPRHAPTHNNLAIVYLDWGEPERARELLLKAIALPSYLPPYNAFNNLSRTAIQEGRYDEAVQWAEKTLAANPDYPSALVRLAVAHALRGDAAQAKAAAARLLELSPDWVHEIAGERPWPGKEQQYEAYMAGTYRPALHLAGLPVR